MENTDTDTKSVLLTTQSNSHQFKKLSKLQWNKIEKNYEDDITKAVLNTMQKLGSSDNLVTDIVADTKTCGNEIYLSLRKLLYENKLIEINKEVELSIDGITVNGLKFFTMISHDIFYRTAQFIPTTKASEFQRCMDDSIGIYK